MKKVLMIVILALAMVAPGWAVADVQTSVGTMNVGGKLKVHYSYVQQHDDSGIAGYNGIYTAWAELDFRGTVGDNVSYVVELAYGGPQFAMQVPPTEPSNKGPFGAIGIRQAYIAISDIIPMTTVLVGTVIPPITNYMPRPVNDYDMINMPLINDARNLLGQPKAGLVNQIPTHTYDPSVGIPPDYSVWQQTGVVFVVKPLDMLEIDWGLVDGAMGGSANQQVYVNGKWGDYGGMGYTDKMFANGLRVAVTPLEGLVVAGSYWNEPFNFDEAVWLNVAPGSIDKRVLEAWAGSVAYSSAKFELTADYVQMSVPDYVLGADGKLTRWTGEGWQATAGVWITDQIETLFRFDQLNPNTLDNKKVGFTKYDIDTWVTFGLNYRINENAELSMNYIWKDEQGKRIEVSEGKVSNPNTGIYRYQDQRNDEFLMQIQVWQ